MSGRDSFSKAQETMRRLQHEVRTPISQIIGYSELIEEELEDRGDEDLAPDLHKIRAAAKRLLDLVDGRLRDDDDPGAPQLPEGSAEAQAAAGQLMTERSNGAANLLVIDNDPDDRDLLARRLERHGFSVETARDGVEGLRMIDAGSFDLVLLEILMPGMNGLEVLERLRRDQSRAELPVILATALGDSDDTVEGLSRGANDYVTKPFDFPVVIARVNTQLEAYEITRQLSGLSKQLEFRNAFIRQALDRDVSDELLVEMAERPGALDLGGEPRRVLALVGDLRGAREFADTLAPAQRVALLANVLGGLSEVVAHYGGTVDAVTGDSVVALFGLPIPRDDDAERAVGCAIALQLEVDEINTKNQRAGLPNVQIGVGVASGDVVIVGFGTGEQLRYKAIGEPLVLAPLVEASAEGGEVWICEDTRNALADLAHLDGKGAIDVPDRAQPLQIHRAIGVGGDQLISLRRAP